MARSIAGLFQDRQSAEQAIVDLKQAGFDPSRIGVVMKDKAAAAEITDEQGTRSTEGAVAGGLIGGTAGALLAAAGALVIPGVGPFISGGILVSLVGGAAGWLVGGLVGLGIPEEEARHYEEQVSLGKALVTVDAQGRDAEAMDILRQNGAENTPGFGNTGSVEQNTGAMYTTGTDDVLANKNTGIENPPVSDTVRVRSGVAGTADSALQSGRGSAETITDRGRSTVDEVEDTTRSTADKLGNEKDRLINQ